MKTLFIPAEINLEISNDKLKEISWKLPKSIALAYPIQYRKIAQKAKEIFSKEHKITKFIQVLGCSKPEFSKDTEAIILISSGRFHAVSLAFESNLPVYLFEGNKLEKIPEKEIENLKAKRKTAYLKFLHAENIGVLISTKPGQENMKRALELRNSIKNKNFYFFIGDNFNSFEFQNFPIDAWVNSACPRLDMDFPVLNIADLK